MLKDTVKAVAYYITGYEHPQKTVSAPGTAPTLLNAFHSSHVTLLSSSCLLGHLLPSSHLVSMCTKPSPWLWGPNLTLVLAYSSLICCPLGSGDTGDTLKKRPLVILQRSLELRPTLWDQWIFEWDVTALRPIPSEELKAQLEIWP